MKYYIIEILSQQTHLLYFVNNDPDHYTWLIDYRHRDFADTFTGYNPKYKTTISYNKTVFSLKEANDQIERFIKIYEEKYLRYRNEIAFILVPEEEFDRMQCI